MNTLSELNESFPEDTYYDLFFSDRYIPQHVLQYIKNYIALPMEELKQYSFSTHPGAPNATTYFHKNEMKMRLLDRVQRYIRFFSHHELSLYRVFIREIEIIDEETEERTGWKVDSYSWAESWSLYIPIQSMYKQLSTAMNVAHYDSRRVEQLLESYQQLLERLGKKIFGSEFQSDYTSSQFWDEFEKIQTPAMDDELNRELEVKPERQNIQYAEQNQMIPFREYLQTCFASNHMELVHYLGHSFPLYKRYQAIFISSYLEAMIYPCMLSTMLERCQEERDEDNRYFLVKETIRTFHPPQTRFSDEESFLDKKMVYRMTGMDMNDLLLLFESEETQEEQGFDEDEWMQAFDRAIGQKTPLSTTFGWRQCIRMAADFYNLFERLFKQGINVMQQGVFDAMQQDYDREKEEEATRREELRIQKMTPLVVHGTTPSDIPVTIYGEIHNNITNKRYIEEQFHERTNITVWVEHAEQYCSVAPHEEPMFAEAKGLEWVWFQRVKAGLPVQCIDIRSSLGLPNALLEDALREVGGLVPLYTDPLRVALRTQFIKEHNMGHPLGLFKFMTTVLSSYKNARKIIQPIREVFGQYMSILKQQLQSVIKMASEEVPLVPISVTNEYDEVDESTTFLEEIKNIVRNMLAVHCLILDAHIMTLLHDYKEDKPIVILVGLNHAIRLAHLLHGTIEPNEHISMQYYQPRAMKAFTPSVLTLEDYRVMEGEGRKRRRRKHSKRVKKHGKRVKKHSQ